MVHEAYLDFFKENSTCSAHCGLLITACTPNSGAAQSEKMRKHTGTAAAAAAKQPRKNKSTSLISPRRKIFRKDLSLPLLVSVQNFKSAREQGTSGFWQDGGISVLQHKAIVNTRSFAAQK